MATLLVSGFENGKSPGGLDFDGLQDPNSTTSLDTTTKQTGTQSLKVATSGNQTYVSKTISTSVVSGIVCIAVDASPSITHNIAVGVGPTNTPRLAMTTARKLRCDIGGNNAVVSTTVLSINTFYYAAYRFDTSGTTYTVDITLYNAAGSFLETLTQKTLAAQTATPMTSLRVGMVAASSGLTTWVDNARATDQSANHPLTPGGVYSPILTDTGSTVTDSVGRVASPVTSDTGTTFTESLTRAARPVTADTATAFSESLLRTLSPLLTDTGSTVSGSLVRRLTPGMSDTAATLSDAVTSGRVRSLSDTGSSIVDLLAKVIPIADDAASPVSSDSMTADPGDGTMGTDDQGTDWAENGPATSITKTGGTAVITMPTATGSGLNEKVLLDAFIGDGDWSLSYSIPSTPIGAGTNIDLLILDGTSSGYRTRVNWPTSGGYFLSISRLVPAATQLANLNLGTPTLGVMYRVKMRRRGASLFAKHWLASNPEPGWMLTPTDTSPILTQGNPGFRIATGASTVGMDYSITNWTLTAGVRDAGIVATYIPKNFYLADVGAAMSNFVRYPPAAGSGVVTGIGIRGIPNNNIFSPDRFATQGGTDPSGVYPVGLRPLLSHTLYPFTASDTSPGTVGGQGRTPIGQDEAWMLQQGAAPIVNIGGLLAGVTFSDFPLYDATNYGTLGCQAITAGAYDSVIDGWARGLAGMQGDVFVRLWREPVRGHPWWTPDPADYIAAYRHVVTRLRLTCHNLHFVFCVGSAGWWLLDGSVGPSQAAMAYYPGDDVTDYIAADGYEHVIQNAKFGWDNSDFYTHFKAGPVGAQGTSWYDWGVSHGKPLMICENGAWPDPAGVEDLKWVNSIIPGLKQLPEIRAFCTWSGLRYPLVVSDGASSTIQAAWEAVFADPYAQAVSASDTILTRLSHVPPAVLSGADSALAGVTGGDSAYALAAGGDSSLAVVTGSTG